MLCAACIESQLGRNSFFLTKAQSARLVGESTPLQAMPLQVLDAVQTAAAFLGVRSGSRSQPVDTQAGGHFAGGLGILPRASLSGRQAQ
jgi:hypothetical protein